MRRNSYSRLALLPLIAVAFSNTLIRAEDAAMPTKVTEIEGISEYSLENGVRVLLFPDASKEVVTVNMTVFVGSRHEGYGEAGMAHLLEHMLFKGTPEHPEIPKVLQQRGARFNGTTWVDRTNYYETLPASEENLKFALDLESDRLMNSFIRGEDLESEMTVVRNEFERGENSPFSVLRQRMQACAYEWHNYGQSTIGNRSDIERVPVVNLRRFYRKYYRPDNLMLIVAGKFDPKRALELIADSFGKLESPEAPLDPTYTTEPPQDGERTVVLRRVGNVQLVGSCYHVPAGSHPDFAAIRALSIVLGDEPSGRLYKGMVEPQVASNAGAFAFAFAEPGLMMSIAEVPESASLESARLKLIETFEESFAEKPVTQEEVDRAKAKILKQREMEANDTDRLAVSLSEWAAQGDWRLYFLFRDIVEELTTEQVQAAAERYFVRNNRTVGLFIPSETSERAVIPEAPNLLAKLEGYKGRKTVQQGEQFDPDPVAIEERTERGTLDCGIKFALLPKKSRGEVVSIRLALRYGTPEKMKGRRAATELVGWLMSRGTKNRNYEAIQDELTRLRAEMQISSVPGLLDVRIKTKREFLDEVIALMGDVLRNPEFKSEELDLIRQQIVTQLQQSSSEPNALAPRMVQRTLSPYGKDDIRYEQTLEEDIEMYRSVSAKEIRALYDDLLGGHVGELAAVGDFEPEALCDAVQSQLAAWKPAVPYERAGRPANTEIAGSVTEIETPDKANAVLFGSMQFDLEDTDPEYASLVLGNFILGGGSLSSRLGDRVRQQEGLSYGVSSGVGARAKDKRVDMTLFAITNPENKDKLIDVIREELALLREKGVTEDELARAKTAYLQSRRVGRTSDMPLASELMGSLFLGRTMQYAADHAAQIEAATVQSVNAAIKKYIDWDRLVVATAGDFAAVAAEAAN